MDVFGTTKASYSFSEFGAVKEKRGSYAQPFGYTSYQYDNTSNLYFAQARYYDPALGRFVSEDKVKGNIIRPDTINPYIYCLSNPLKYVDRDGNSNEDAINGTAAHSALQKYFMELYGGNGGHVEYTVKNYSGSETGVGRIDIALETSEGWEVYEIKPMSCYSNGKGKDQRQNYINALVKSGKEISNKCTFNPNYIDLPSNREGYNFRYYTFEDSPGMIYWSYVKVRDETTEEVPVFELAPQEENEKEQAVEPIVNIDLADVLVFILWTVVAIVTIGFIVWLVANNTTIIGFLDDFLIPEATAFLLLIIYKMNDLLQVAPACIS